MSEEKLKPCPFCGGEIRYMHTNHKNLHNRTHQYNCVKCNAYIFLNAEGRYKTADETKEEAIDTWNRRADNGNV